MFQLTYKLLDTDEFTHQLSQFGGQFVSKGPEIETFFDVESDTQRLRLQEGINPEIILTTLYHHYQEIIALDITDLKTTKRFLNELHGEKLAITNQAVRYHFKKVLFEIHRYEKIGDLLYLQAETLQQLKEIAMQFSLQDRDRVDNSVEELLK